MTLLGKQNIPDIGRRKAEAHMLSVLKVPHFNHWHMAHCIGAYLIRNLVEDLCLSDPKRFPNIQGVQLAVGYQEKTRAASEQSWTVVRLPLGARPMLMPRSAAAACTVEVKHQGLLQNSRGGLFRGGVGAGDEGGLAAHTSPIYSNVSSVILLSGKLAKDGSVHVFRNSETAKVLLFVCFFTSVTTTVCFTQLLGIRFHHTGPWFRIQRNPHGVLQFPEIPLYTFHGIELATVQT